MNIRLMTQQDYDVVDQLWRSIPGMGLNDIDDTRAGIEKYLRRNPTTCFVAEESGQIIGAILAGHDGRRGFIYHTAVLPAHQKKGVGTGLVNAALDALQTEGIVKAALVVFDRNENGNRFWDAQGFTRRSDLVYRNKPLAEIRRIDT